MTISDMEVWPVAHREPPLRNAWGAHSELAARTIVRLIDRDGTVGVGETYGDPDVINRLERVIPTVEGMNPYAHRPIRLQLQDEIVYGAIETALFDLLGRKHGAPVHMLLGGAIRSVIPYSAYLFFKFADSDPENAAIAPGATETPEEMVTQAESFVNRHGFEVLKLKAGVFDPETDIATVEALAERFGPDYPIRIDPNGAWSVERSIAIAKRLRRIDATIQFLEDPAPTMHAHSRLKRHTDYPIATNMFVTDRAGIAQSMEPPAVDIILSDHHYWGGLTGMTELDATAAALDLGLGMHSNSHLGVSMAAMTHVAATMPTLRYACDTHYPWMADDVIRDGPLPFDQGSMPVPDDPGLGIRIDDDALDRMNARYEASDTLGYSTVDSMASAYADAMAERDDNWYPHKPRW